MRRQGQGVVRGAWAVGAVLVVLVGGCAGEPVPERSTVAAVTPTMSATPAPSPPPRPQVPEGPAEMAAPSSEGALAAATYFMELYDHAFGSGDESRLAEMSAPGCLFCQDAIAEVVAMREEGIRAVRSPMEVLGSSVTETRPGEWYDVELQVQQGRIHVLDRDGSTTASSQSVPVMVRLALSWIGAWSVDAVDIALVGS